MFGTIRKHQQWLWIVVVAGVIISFTAWFSPNQPALRSLMSEGSRMGSIDGREITQDKIITANRLAKLREQLFNRGSRSSDNTQEMLSMLLVNEKIKAAGIEVGDEEVSSWIRNNLTDPRTGQFNYQSFITNFVQASGFTETDFTEFVRHDIGRRHLMEMVGASGKFVTPRQAESDFRRENEEYAVSVVLFPSSNYLAGVKIDAAALPQFYTNRIQAYKVAERVQASYLKFDASNHLATADAELAKISDLASRLENLYTQRGADAFRDESGNVMTKDAALAKMKEDQRKGFALELARSNGVAFYNKLTEEFGALAAQADGKPFEFDFEAAATKAGRAPLLTEPFSRGGLVPGFMDLRRLPEEAFKLNAETPFTTPMVGESAVYIFAVKRRIPEEYRPFEQVRAEVTEAYRREQANLAARAAGTAFAGAVTNGLSKGMSFAAVAADKGLKVVDLPTISPGTRMLPGFESYLSSIKSAVFALKPGQASDYMMAGQGGFVAFLKERKQADEAKLKSELPTYLEQLREQNEFAVYQEWFNREFERSGLQQFQKGGGGQGGQGGQ